MLYIFQDETINTTTRSELSFVPSTEDDGKSITCRAENPNVTGLFLETTWKLNVVCKWNWDFFVDIWYLSFIFLVFFISLHSFGNYVFVSLGRIHSIIYLKSLRLIILFTIEMYIVHHSNVYIKIRYDSFWLPSGLFLDDAFGI